MSDFLLGIKITIKDLLSRKGRSFLTILGVVIGVAGVIIIISLGAGAQSLVVGQITKLGNNIVGVLPGKSNEKGPPASVFGIQIKTLSNRDLDSLRDKNKILNSISVAPVVSGVVTVIYNKESVDTNFVGTDDGYPLVQNVEMEKGSFFSKADIESRENVILLGKEVSDVLFPNGNEIGKIVKVKSVNSEAGGIPFRVIGVQKRMGNVGFQNQDDKVFIPLSIAQNQILGINYLQAIYLKIDKEENVLSSMEDVRDTLRENHKIKDSKNEDFDVRNLSDAIKMITSITDILRIFLGLMAGISLVVGGIGIMNIMLVTVSERTREIGLRKAIGATSKKIRNQFLTEAIILTLTGGIVGIILGIFISYLIAIIARFAGYDWAFIISSFSIILAVSVSVLTGIIFGIYPALKASKLDPIEALRYE